MGVLRVRFSQSSERRGVFNYALKVEVVDAMGIPRKIFVYHQSPAGIDGNTFAEFDHIATPVDFQEIPENAASESVPWFRTDKCVIWFRSVSDMNLAKQMFVDDINALQRTYDVLTSENSFTRQTDVNFSKDGVHETDVNADPISEDIKAMKEDIVGKLSKDAMSGVELETNTAEGIRKAVQSIGNILGANIVKSIAIGFIVSACAMGQAFGAGFSGERFGDIDLDENPVVVTNVTFDGLATVSDIETNYYTKAETDDAIDAIAAYYITSDVQGSAFTNYLALTNAAAYYSGGVIRSPTRNDYAVVLADETHGGAEYRYIYAVPDGSTTGQWEAQYPIEINDYGQLSNKPQINGNTLTGNKTAAQLGIASTADATLTERGFSEWTISPAISNPVSAECLAAFQAMYPDVTSGVLSISAGGAICIGGQAATVTQDISADGTTLSFNGHGWANLDTYLGISVGDTVATRTALQGYVLGSQTDKPLASEAEAEALRTNKLDKSAVVAPSTSATTGQAADAKATGDALAPLLFAQYYPDGSVTGASDFTQGIKYSFDTTNRTAFVKPFCNTGTAADDNSSLVGKVVIPPFVDAQGNRYISDDGTRFKVTAVASGGATASNPDLGAIVAPTTVTSIGDHAFAACTSLASVSLPAATSIGMDAFNYCTSLASISLPAATSIGSYAFANCTSLPSVTLPAATSIGYRAFNNCTPLASVTLPAATNIGDHAFAACTSLASVSLPAATSIGMDAFNYCTSLASISLPAATSIGSYAFDGCTSLASVSLPAATSIGMYAFYGCTPLASVTLPAATSIGYRAFNGCTSLASVDFGATARSSVPTLGSNAFQNVPDTCKIIVPDAQYDAWTAASDWSDLVTAGYKFLKHSEWEYARKYEVDKKADKPATFTTGNLAKFDANGNPTDSGLPKDDVESLFFAQYYPEGNVKSAAEFTQGIKYGSFDDVHHTVSVLPFCNTGIATNDNSSLSGRVVIPPFVDADGNPYVSDDGTRFRVVGVGSGSDSNNSNENLTAVIAPSTVTNIEDKAFRRCTKLTSVSTPAATSIGSGAFNTCTSLASVSLPAVASIGTYAFNSCTKLASVSIPAATNIQNYAFYSCAKLTSVSIPAAKRIGGHVFDACTALASVSLPATTSVGGSAFNNCNSLASVSLPVVTSIDGYSFAGCTSLTSVDFGATLSSVPTIVSSAFNSVSTSCKIIVPDSQYDAWIAASGWSTLYNNGNGYKFLRHSEWEYAHKYELAGKVSTTALTGEAMPANPTQNELAEAVKKIFTALGGTVTP